MGRLNAAVAALLAAAAAATDPQALVKEMAVELRDASAAKAEQQRKAAAEREDHQAKASHLARLSEDMDTGLKQLKEEKFKEDSERFEARRSQLHARRNKTSLAQQAPEDGNAMVEDAKAAAASATKAEGAAEGIVRSLKEHRQKVTAHARAKEHAAPIHKLLADMHDGVQHIRQKQATQVVSDIKQEQKEFDERRKKLLARENSPTRLRQAAAAKATKKAAAPLLQKPPPQAHPAPLSGGGKAHRSPGKAVAAHPLRKSAADLEEEKVFDQQARQCAVEGLGCWRKYEGCAQDFCSLMTQLSKDQCFQKATLAHHRMEVAFGQEHKHSLECTAEVPAAVPAPPAKAQGAAPGKP